MIVRYALSRGEIAKSVWYSLKYSGTFRLRIVLLAGLPAGVSLTGAYLGRHVIGAGDLLIAAVWVVGALSVMPAILVIRAKTEERVLELMPDGIKTSIGRLSGTVPWSSIAFVHDVGGFVVIGGKNTNAFLIPSRAFASPDERTQFVSRAHAWTIAAVGLR